ncbi:MAG: zinc-dependent alcohol dehydrogenase [Candidatus Helarchaeota archaeon]
MKVAFFQGPNKDPLFKIEEAKLPIPNENEVLVKNYASALCGTDLHIIDGSLLKNIRGEWLAYAELPIIIGHEAAGIVERVGKNVKRLEKGDRIFTAPNIFCGHCSNCIRGNTNLCNNRKVIGLHYPGFHQEYFVCDEKSLYKLPDNIDFDEGCLIGDTLGTAYHAIKRVQIQPGDIVSVWGLGPIGITVAQMAKLVGASKVIAIDVMQARIKLANELHLDHCVHSDEASALIKSLTKNEGVDVSIEVTGIDKVLENAFNTTRKGGKVLVVGIHSKKLDLYTLALSYREISMIGTFSHKFCESEHIINLISSKKVNLKSLISHKFPLSEINEAYKLFIAKKTNKVILNP